MKGKKMNKFLKTVLNKAVAYVKANAGRAVAAVAIVIGFASTASAQTDLTATITTIEGYWDAVLPIGIGIILFVVGRKVVKKL